MFTAPFDGRFMHAPPCRFAQPEGFPYPHLLDPHSGRKSANHLKMKLLATYLIGSLNDIHNQLYSECIYSFEKNTNLLKSSFSNGVLSLQNYTNESYQVSHSELSEVSEVGPCLHCSNSHSLAGTQFDTNSWGLKDLASYMDNRQSLVCNDGTCSADGYLSNRRMYQAYPDKRIVNGESSFQEEAEANVHLGAPPPWFDATEENPLNEQVTLLLLAIRKSQLYPKQMGAAWEEKRKIEMERKGEIVTNNFDVNWLPNLDRVWQSGSLKDSRKEFEVENKHSSRAELQSETSIKIQPYISKQMVHVWQLVNLLASVHVHYKSLFLCQMGNEGVATIEQMEVNDTFGGDHVKRITDGLDFKPLDLKYRFILNSRLDGAIILFVMRGKIMDGFSLKLSS
ncbi:hypothetical protein ACSBR1_042900 [Camellia fascicularis]